MSRGSKCYREGGEEKVRVVLVMVYRIEEGEEEVRENKGIL